MATRTTRRTRRSTRRIAAQPEEVAGKQAAEEAKAAAQTEKEAKAAAEKAEREAAKEAARQAKIEAARAAKQELLDSGKLIEDGEAEYHLIEREETPTVEQRAMNALEYLQEHGREVPVLGKTLQKEFGGGWPQWLSFFSMLKACGLVREYRMRTGERGGGGVSYLYVGDED